MSSIEKMIDRMNQQSEQEHVELVHDVVAQQKETSPKSSHSARVQKSAFNTGDNDQIVNVEVLPEWDNLLADEYRRIKRPLIANAFGKQADLVKNGNLIIVTSSMPGEGKSFTAQNLAQSIAMERDRTVLLIDADITKSTLSRSLKLDDRPGLTDVLLDDSMDLANVITDTNFPCLKMISSGKHHEHTTELLASNRMRNLLAELADRYHDRVIILDSPPVLATPETQILCELAGQIVFVVESEKTPKATIQQALDLISDDKDKPIGLVLNKNPILPGLQYHGAYYGY